MRMLLTATMILAVLGTTSRAGIRPGGVDSLTVDRSGVDLVLSWSSDCGSGDGYSIYRGDLSLGYDSAAIETCDLPGTSATLVAGTPAGEFFLVVPSLSGAEGSYGWDGSCDERLPALAPCHPPGLIDICADQLAPLRCGVSDCGNGMFEPTAAVPEECDDVNSCPLDGCDGESCTRTESVVLASMVFSSTGFDLDNLDGDNNVYTGVDNLLGSNSLVTDQANVLLTDGINDGSFRLVISLSDLDSFTDDAELTVAAHSFVDPDCPSTPVYSAANLPPWIDSPPADVFSNSDELGTCSPLWVVTDADDPANGLYPINSDPSQPAAPYVSIHSEQATVPLFGTTAPVTFPRLEATVQSDGSRVTALNDGLFGMVVSPSTLLALPGTGGCPTLLHVVACLVGDVDIDVEGTGLDSIPVTGCGIACVLLANAQIPNCIDGDTGASIPSVTNGDCVLDPRIADGYSAAFDVNAVNIDIVEQVSSLEYCP